MAQAAQRRFIVSKPWGDMQAYDVGIEHAQNFLRVQVKSTTSRFRRGLSLHVHAQLPKKRDYSLDQIDLFAAYVIPVDAWYLIPGSPAARPRRTHHGHAKPSSHAPAKKACYRYECYRGAWNLLRKSRLELEAPDADARPILSPEGRNMCLASIEDTAKLSIFHEKN